MAVAIELARAGRSVEIVDDGIRPGGSLRGLFREASGWKSIEEPFQDLVSAERIALFTRTLVGGVFGEDLLVIASSGADVVTARETIFATGAHDGVGLFEGNDLPGVMSARAGCILFADGVVVGKRVAIASRAPGSFGDAFARAAADFCEVITVPSVIGVRGSSAVRAVQVQDGDRQREVRVDALLTDEARSPAYELCLQAGAELVHEPKGFVVRADHGRIREHFWAVGEVRGTALEPQAILDDAKRVASGILA
jgi:sarcosine oxidase subunit alpha